MPNVKYTDSATFRCLENLKEGSLISVWSIRATNTAHPDISVPCQEMSSSSILYWTVPDSILPEVRPGALLPDRCLWFILMNQSHTELMKPIPGLMHGLVSWNPCSLNGKSMWIFQNQLVLPAPDQKIILKHIAYMLDHKQLSKANDLRRQAYLILLLAELADFHEKQSAQNKKC